MTQLIERRRRFNGEERKLEAVQPTLEPGKSLTAVPPWWCSKCERARGGRRCGVCGGQTVARADLPTDPAAAAVAALAVLQGVSADAVDVTVERLEGAAAEPPPPDPADIVYAPTIAAPATLDGNPAPRLLQEPEPEPELELDDDAPELEQLSAELDDDDDDAPELAPRRPTPGSVLDRLAQRNAERAATPRNDPRLVGRTWRETRIMTRPKAPMSRGVVDRERPSLAGHPLRSDESPTRTRHLMQPGQRSREMDDRGREVQRTTGRNRRGSIEDKLWKMWEGAKVDRAIWSQYFCAATQRLVEVETEQGVHLVPISVDDAAEIADAMYMQLLARDNASQAG